MPVKSAMIISPLPLKPVKCGMQNTIDLLYKYLKKKNYKIVFFQINTENEIDPVLNLKFRPSIIKNIEKKIFLNNINLVFINTTKILSFYEDLFFNKNFYFKTVLVCHDLYHFRKKYFKKLEIKDKTPLTLKKESNVLKKVDYIIDFSQDEEKFMKKINIGKKKLIKTLTPMNKFKRVISTKKKQHDLLYISSNWHQNKVNINSFLKRINYKKNNFKLLIVGNLNFNNKFKTTIKVKRYSAKNIKTSKIGIAIMKIGTGRKTKIFEMLAYGLPTLTNIDLTNYGLKNNFHYKLVTKKNSVSKEINSVLKDNNLRKKLSINSFNWSRNNTYYEKAFKPMNKIL